MTTLFKEIKNYVRENPVLVKLVYSIEKHISIYESRILSLENTVKNLEEEIHLLKFPLE